MTEAPENENQVDQVIFDTGSVRVGAFRCHPSHPSFHDTGPSSDYCFVFPRTAVEIQHEHEPAFVANPNVVTFYNKGQTYLRNAISADGDRCEWFGVDLGIAQDVLLAFDASLESHPEKPFQISRGLSDSSTYLRQRLVFRQVSAATTTEPLAVEEAVIGLLESVIRSAYRQPARGPGSNLFNRRHRDIVHHAELLLSTRLEERITLSRLAGEVDTSMYHLCRVFHRATGYTLHDYRQSLRLRWTLENVAESSRPLVDIALESGFSSHSHFTSLFHREFARTPSAVRSGKENHAIQEQNPDSGIAALQLES